MPNVPYPAPLSTYVAGDTWTTQLVLTVGGEAADAATLSARVERPDASHYDIVYGTDAVLVRASKGVYHAIVPGLTKGRWKIRWTSTVVTTEGTITRVAEWWCDVLASKVT